MNTKLIAAVIGCLIIAGSVLASVPVNTYNNILTMKGYVTIGRNVVVLQERLQRGDRIVFYNMRGSKVFEQYVGTGYLAANISNLSKGFYNLTVFRNGRAISSQKIPFIGNGGR